MVVAAFSGGMNFSGGGGGSGGGGEEFKLPKAPPTEKLPEQTSQVLGTATSSIVQIFTNTPVWVWIVLGVSILAAIGIAITVSLFIRNWGKGALITSIHEIEDQKSPSLSSGSKSGLAVVKRFIYLHVVPWFVWIILVVVLSALAVGIIIITTRIESEVLKILTLVFCMLIWVFWLIGSWLFLNLAIILGEQLVIRQNLSAREALRKGFNLTKKYFTEILGMGVINFGIGCAFGCLTILLFALLAVMVVVAFTISKTAGFILGAIAAIPILAFILFSLLIRGIYMVFNTATWTLLVREIEQTERNGVTNGK